MKIPPAAVLVAFVLGGCVATDQSAPSNLLGDLGTIAVVAIETGPFNAHPSTDGERAILRDSGLVPSYNSSSPSQPSSPAGVLLPLPDPRLNRANAALGVIGLVGASMPGAEDKLIFMKEPSPGWMLTKYLAGYAVQLLQESGRKESFALEGYIRLPVADRSITGLMENWMAPKRAWYNANSSTVEYALGSKMGAAILEVGTCNYEREWIGGRLVVQINVKLIDLNSRKVIARAREWDFPEVKPLSELLRDHAVPLKAQITSLGQTLLTKCLQDIGLIPRIDRRPAEPPAPAKATNYGPKTGGSSVGGGAG